MKKSQLIINIVFGVAIVALYALHFLLGGSKTTDTTVAVNDSLSKFSPGSEVIAFVNIDTLLGSYDLYDEFRSTFEQKAKASEAQLNTRAKELEKGIQDLQYKMQKGLVTRSTAAEMEQKLAIENQQVMQLRDKLSMDLAEEEQVMNRQLIEKIMKYLEEYNADNKYNYIFSTSFGGNILYANTSLDITKEVIKGLNDQHITEKESTKQSKK